MTPHTIGILAGMGPRSTAPFVDLVVTECQKQYGARHVEDFPHMLIYSLPAPLSSNRPVDHQRAQRVVLEGLQRLESMGVDFIAMPCNSAHTYFQSLVASAGVPLLNMVNEGVGALDCFHRVMVCATPMTMASGLYQQGIAAAGKQCLPTDGVQSMVNELIAGIIAGVDRVRLRRLWNDIITVAVAQCADAILVACTELNALGNLQDERIAMADATVALARATVKKYLEGNRALRQAAI
ncbi:MAG: amino acid racemase [Acidobacteriia bacterium]|nr:amino acid racemase [Terriglobia bacterium]